MAGYSGTPLAKKLGIVDGARIAFSGRPKGFEIRDLPRGVSVQSRIDDGFDVALIFVTERDELRREFEAASHAARPDSSVWIAWPKRSSGVETDVTEDVLRAELLSTGWVDNKVCAIDATWSGLRFVLRKELRPKVAPRGAQTRERSIAGSARSRSRR